MGAFLRRYATTTTLNFPLVSFNSVSFTSTASLTTADMKLSLNEGAFTTVGTAIVNEGSFGYSYACTTADLTAARVMMIIKHTAATVVFEDQCILVETYGNTAAQHTWDFSLAQVVTVGTISAGAVGAGMLSAGAFAAGFFSAGGVAAGAISAGAIAAGAISAGGIAAGAISAGGIATDAIDADALAADAVTEIWNVAAIQPTAVPSITATVISAFSWIYTLSRNRITQSSTVQTIFQTDGLTSIAASSVSDDGTTFTKAIFTS